MKTNKTRTRFQKTQLYGVFRRTRTGILEGYCEYSICMGWENTRVRAFQDVKAAKYHQAKTSNSFICRLNAKTCPVELVNWHPSKDKKFEWRNPIFKLKPTT
jgi:hypothetical protein